MEKKHFQKLGIGTFFYLILLASLVESGPPLQGEVPIGLFPAKEDLNGPETQNKDRFLYLKDEGENEKTYRLPLSIRPIHYDLEIRPIMDGPVEERFTAPGKVTIRVQCFEATDSITLHSNEIKIQDNRITVVDVDSGEEIKVNRHSVDEPRAFFIIHLNKTLTVGKQYFVTIPFTSLVSSDRLNGLYRSSYKADNGETRYLATTQFQKRDASKAFPCFDVFEFKCLLIN